MILFIRDNECFEPRVKNYLSYYKKNNVAYHVIAWNRDGSADKDRNITFFQHRAEYGKRIANIPNKLRWMLFVISQIYKRRHNCKCIHACDIDCALPALIIGKILKIKVIFDIFDWVSAPDEKKTIVYQVVDALQNFCYRHSDYVLLCAEERKKQARANNKNIYVLPNIPNNKIAFDESVTQQINELRQAYKLVLSYVGVFDKDRGLENMLEAVAKTPDVLFNIAGFGALSPTVEEYADKYSNIKLWGRVRYNVGQTIMKNSDLIVAMYYLTNPIHRYAAPNKYYESLMLGVPIITTKNTLVGIQVNEFDTGYVLDETEEALANMLSDEETINQLGQKKKNCEVTWEKVYAKYYDDFMETQYLKMIN